ncbi:hypothetical protein D3C84_1094830 [compost metagenome]
MEKYDVLSFNDVNGEKITLHKFKSNLIYKKDAPVQHGVPLHGWLVFSGPREIYGKKVEAYRLVCIDAGFKRHTLVIKPGEMFNLMLLQQIADVDAPENYKSPQFSQ